MPPRFFLAACCSLASTLLWIGCASAPPTPPPDGRDEAGGLLVVADPQIHNVYADRLFQMSVIADLGTGVARRPPELNLLARYALEDLLARGRVGLPEDSPVVVLGDATNVACTSEWDEFTEAMDRGLGEGSVWLMAHGNHDSYLMGVANDWVPGWIPGGWPPPLQMRTSMYPTEESWWGAPTSPAEFQGTGWKPACFTGADADGGLPLNKVRWLAAYMAHLRDLGLDYDPAAESASPSVEIDLRAAPDTPLAAIDYRMRGRWTRPTFAGQATESDLTRGPFSSFVVQSADLPSGDRLLLIDTSVRPFVSWPDGPSDFLDFKRNSAGSIGALGDDQLAVIREVVAQTPVDQGIVVGGHFNFGLLDREDRAALIDILSERHDWAYLSGHTHTRAEDGAYRVNWGSGIEVNVGSTTDWPMVAHRLDVAAALDGERSSRPLFVREDPGVRYVPALELDGTELCRHLPVAEALAELRPEDVVDAAPGAPWRPVASPTARCQTEDADDWAEMAARLRAHRATIEARYRRDEPGYREAILRVAAAASFYEAGG